MKTLKFLIGITLSGLTAALISGCNSLSNIRENVAGFDMDHLRTFDVHVLAEAYYDYRVSNERAEGKSRVVMELDPFLYYLATPEAMAQLEQVLLEKGITEEELETAREGKIFVGMSMAALYASAGKPYRENRTGFAGGEHIQHVYGYSSSRWYAYTVNGVVTTYQL